MLVLPKKLVLILKLLGITLLSILIRGYQYGSGNQVHYFNFAFHKLYPTFFANDYLFKIHDLPYTIFVDSLYWILKIFGENQFVFFLIYFVLLFLFYSVLYLITNFFFNNQRVSLLTLLFFIFPIPIGGSTINTVEKSIMPRFVAEVALLFSLYFLLIKRNITSALIAGIGFLIHPLSLIPYLPIVFLTGFFGHNFKATWKQLSLTALVFTLVSFPILYKFISGSTGGKLLLDTEWLTIIKDRLPYIFILSWSLINFLILLAICVFFASYNWLFKKPLHPTVKAIFFVSLGCFVVALVSSLVNFRLGLQLQLARNLYLLVVFTVLLGVGFILSKLSPVKLHLVALATIFLGILICLPGRFEYGALWFNPLDNYQQAAVWAQGNTPKDSTFLVPLDEFGFRFWSKRGVFLEVKEGGDSLYKRDFALYWNSREELVKRNANFNRSFIVNLKTNYAVDYIITTKSIPGLEVVYKNSKYTIYKI